MVLYHLWCVTVRCFNLPCVGVVALKNRLEEVLAERGIKKKWLAEKVGIDRNTLNNLIAGTVPRLTLARQIAKTLSLSVDYIWPDEESPD